jgi:hypothetical protein
MQQQKLNFSNMCIFVNMCMQQVLKALYSMSVVALRWYKQFTGDLEKIGFVFKNPYDSYSGMLQTS